MRVALNDAAPLYRDAPEACEAKTSSEQAIERFMAEVLPDASPRDRTLAGDLITTTLSCVGRQSPPFGRRNRTLRRCFSRHDLRLSR